MSRTTVLDIAVFTCSEPNCRYKTSMQNVTLLELTVTVRGHVNTHYVEKNTKPPQPFFMPNLPVDVSGPGPIRSMYVGDPTAYFIKHDIIDRKEVIDSDGFRFSGAPVADSEGDNNNV